MLKQNTLSGTNDSRQNLITLQNIVLSDLHWSLVDNFQDAKETNIVMTNSTIQAKFESVENEITITVEILHTKIVNHDLW